ncbi:MAG: hypothetical protein ACRC7O_09415 [Fimbriiglobus sp.]
MRTVRSVLTATFTVALVVGCGGDARQQPTYPVTGSVNLDGKPLAGATVVFHPADPSTFKWDERPQGRTDESGKFTLFTYRKDDGAPAGEYKVGVAVLQGGDEEGGDQVKRVRGTARVPARYADHKTSGIAATVTTSATALKPIELSSK